MQWNGMFWLKYATNCIGLCTGSRKKTNGNNATYKLRLEPLLHLSLPTHAYFQCGLRKSAT